MPLSVVSGDGIWVPGQVVSVSDGAGGWRPAKSIKRADGAGHWNIVWVPTSTVILSGSAVALSSQSGSNGAMPPYIAPATLTVTLGNFESVSNVALQESQNNGTSWTDVAVWPFPTSADLTHQTVLGSAGARLFRAVLTHYDTQMVYSNTNTVTWYTKTLVAVTSNPSPTVDEPFELSAAESAPEAAASEWFYRAGGSWLPYGSGENPQIVAQDNTEPYDWTYQQIFVDGSTIYSSPVTVTATTS